ncbi:MAG: hypothetical protein ACFCGT_19485 [Sandaracinaceae bacterium]
MPPPRHRLLIGPASAERVAAAARAVAAASNEAGAPAWDRGALLVAPSRDAVEGVILEAAAGRPLLGGEGLTPGARAARLAAPSLAARGRSPASRDALEALAARALRDLAAAGRIGRLRPIAGRAGTPRALRRTLDELAKGGEEEAPAPLDPDLRALQQAFRRALAEAGLADRAEVLRSAIATILSGEHPLLDRALVVLDVPVATRLEAAWWSALATRAPILAVVPRGDRRTEAALAAALGVEAEELALARDGSLQRLQDRLFAAGGDDAAAEACDDGVVLSSAPGESRECVEIARAILDEARRGTAFDRIAVLLHQPAVYGPHVVEAFRRARVPAAFRRAATYPAPAGRALLALLRCRDEGPSAEALADYLALGVVPRLDADGAPELEEGASPWSPPAEAPLPAAAEGWLDDEDEPGADEHAEAAAGASSAARGEAPGTGADDGRARAAFVRRLLDDLAALPEEASWDRWADALGALAERAIREPGPILAALERLRPLAAVGPVPLREVAATLSERLLSMPGEDARGAAGRGFVGSTHDARGLAFEVVFVPGVVERGFPREVREDPLLRDDARLGLGLPTFEDRVAEERLALRLAVGAASRAVRLSYPRLDRVRGQPRVPSFYGLEVIRAAEGRLPTFEELEAGAEAVGGSAWPAPATAEGAVDAAEYDLAVLRELLGARSSRARAGAARYLLAANPHLARALRARWLAWQSAKWTRVDGLVDPGAEARALLGGERSAREGELEAFAACPYRYFLRVVAGLPGEPDDPPPAGSPPAARRDRAEAALHAAWDRAFFVAAPAPGACARCAYRPVCGPEAERRVAIKVRRSGLGPLDPLRRAR